MYNIMSSTTVVVDDSVVTTQCVGHNMPCSTWHVVACCGMLWHAVACCGIMMPQHDVVACRGKLTYTRCSSSNLHIEDEYDEDEEVISAELTQQQP